MGNSDFIKAVLTQMKTVYEVFVTVTNVPRIFSERGVKYGLLTKPSGGSRRDHKVAGGMDRGYLIKYRNTFTPAGDSDFYEYLIRVARMNTGLSSHEIGIICSKRVSTGKKVGEAYHPLNPGVCMSFSRIVRGTASTLRSLPYNYEKVHTKFNETHGIRPTFRQPVPLMGTQQHPDKHHSRLEVALARERHHPLGRDPSVARFIRKGSHIKRSEMDPNFKGGLGRARKEDPLDVF